MTIKSMFLAFILMLSTTKLFSQTTEGQISYKIEITGDSPEMANAATMLQGSLMELYFIKDKTAVEMKMGEMMKMKTSIDAKLNKGIILMEVMGNKIATKIDDVKNNEESPKEEIVATAETKTILGFNCKKYIKKNEQGKTLIIWTTKDIVTNLVGQQQFVKADLGIPLEFSTSDDGMTMNFTATSFNKKVDSSIFKLDVPEGYNVMTEEELKQMGG